MLEKKPGTRKQPRKASNVKEVELIKMVFEHEIVYVKVKTTGNSVHTIHIQLASQILWRERAWRTGD